MVNRNGLSWACQTQHTAATLFPHINKVHQPISRHTGCREYWTLRFRYRTRKNRRWCGQVEGRYHEIERSLKKNLRADFVRESFSSTSHALALYSNSVRCGGNGHFVLYNNTWSSRSLLRPSLAFLRYNGLSGIYRVDMRYSLRILSFNSLLKYNRRNLFGILQFPTLYIATLGTSTSHVLVDKCDLLSSFSIYNIKYTRCKLLCLTDDIE